MGTLFIVSTPIGNLEDITIRALKTLFSVDVIACEDTRVTGLFLELLKKKYVTLLSHIHKPVLLSYRDENEESVAAQLIRDLQQGKDIALVSDSGTPLVSDPGFRIVSLARKNNIPVIVVPGVSAFLTALTGSGLPTDTFTFLGYLPEKQGRRIAELDAIKARNVISETFAVYVAPHKLLHTLEDVRTVFGNIPIVLCRELTKLHEEYFHGTIREAIDHFNTPKGEFVLLFNH